MIPLDRALVLARIALAFGRVERATFHEDGVRPETDTDHTVMLGLVACELAPAHLDRAKVAAFALVHDLAEVYAGDTQTLVISAEGMIAKRDREDAARARLATELGAGSWVAEILATYEEQQVPEARFVRAIDKVLPKLTHFFNGCAGARALTDRAGLNAAHDRQYESLRRAYPELPDALDLLRASMVRAEECWPASEECREPCAPDLARDVLSLADALATAEASVAQLRADLERADHERQRVESERDAMEEQRDTARSALDALLRGAPCGYVPAGAVRAYLAAVEAFNDGALGAPCRASIRVDDTRAALVAALERCP